MVLGEGRSAACAAGVGGARELSKDCAGEGLQAGGRDRRNNRRRGGLPMGIAPIREEREKVVNAAAAARRSETQANVEELFSGADGVGVHGEGLAWGNRPHGETRPRTQDGQAESARLARGQHKHVEWRNNHAGWSCTRVRGQLVDRGL